MLASALGVTNHLVCQREFSLVWLECLLLKVIVSETLASALCVTKRFVCQRVQSNYCRSADWKTIYICFINFIAVIASAVSTYLTCL